MMCRTIAAVDPGLSGAIAVMDLEGRLIEVIDMPTLLIVKGKSKKQQLDLHTLAALIQSRQPGHVFIEKVGGMPGQGASHSFNFGDSYGSVKGIVVALGIPMTLIPSATWKARMGLRGADKDTSRQRAMQLFPSHAERFKRKKDDGRAEATLLAAHALTTINVQRGEAA